MWCLPGTCSPRTSPTAFVVSMNLKRRHYTASQRAVIAETLRPRFEAEAKARMAAGSRDKVAEVAGVSPRTAEHAHVVVTKGVPELVGGRSPCAVAGDHGRRHGGGWREGILGGTEGVKPLLADARTVGHRRPERLSDGSCRAAAASAAGCTPASRFQTGGSCRWRTLLPRSCSAPSSAGKMN